MSMLRFVVPCLIGLVMALPGQGLSGEKGMAGDAEAAKHGFESAMLQVVEEENLTDFIFRQYDLGVLSHFSYLLGSEGEAIVVDPCRDVDRYVKDAKELGLKITGIYLTHSHADFVAGHMELARETGAPIYINRLSEAGYKHVSTTDNYELKFGNVRCVVRNTPGHTPDGTCLFVYYPAASKDPRLVSDRRHAFHRQRGKTGSHGREVLGRRAGNHDLQHLEQYPRPRAGSDQDLSGSRGGIPVRREPQRRYGVHLWGAEEGESLHPAQEPDGLCHGRHRRSAESAPVFRPQRCNEPGRSAPGGLEEEDAPCLVSRRGGCKGEAGGLAAGRAGPRGVRRRTRAGIHQHSQHAEGSRRGQGSCSPGASPSF